MCSILNDTPVKNAIVVLENKVKAKKRKSNKNKKGKTKPSKRNKRKSSASDSSADKRYCLVCVEPYSNDVRGEQ